MVAGDYFYYVIACLCISGRSSDDKFCSADAFHWLVRWQLTFNLLNQDVSSLVSEVFARLVDGGEHWVAGNGTLAVGETTDADVARHIISQTFDGMQDAHGSVVVDGKESVGVVRALHDIGGHFFGTLAVVAYIDERLIDGQAVSEQSVLVAIHAILDNFEIERTAIECNALAARLDEVADSTVGTMIIIHYYTRGVETSADAVIEDQRHAIVNELLKMTVLVSFLGL